jgi:chromosome segregation ATPase
MEAEKVVDDKQLVRTERIDPGQMSLEQRRQADRLYHQLGLGPVVEKVLKGFNSSLAGMDRTTDRIFGPFDVRGRAEAVSKVTALATYAALSQHYNEEVSNLEKEIDKTQAERDKERDNYDRLVQKVADIVGGDYNELKADYSELVGKLSQVEGLQSRVAALDRERGDLAQNYEARIQALQQERREETEHLKAQLDRANHEKEEQSRRYDAQTASLRQEHREEVSHLRSQLEELTTEKTQLTERYQAELSKTGEEHRTEVDKLTAQISEQRVAIERAQADNRNLDSELERLKDEHAELQERHGSLTANHRDLQARHDTLSADYGRLKTMVQSVGEGIPYEEIRKAMGPELHTFLLKDSRVPGPVMDGVGKFIDFRKYLGIAAETGAREAAKHTEEVFRETLDSIQ